jgi:hypothetical protein
LLFILVSQAAPISDVNSAKGINKLLGATCKTMNITQLRRVLYAFGLPMLWWGSVSLSSPLSASSVSQQELKFLPVSLHAFNQADYGEDHFGNQFVPLDLALIKSATDNHLGPKSQVVVSDYLPVEQEGQALPKAERDEPRSSDDRTAGTTNTDSSTDSETQDPVEEPAPNEDPDPVEDPPPVEEDPPAEEPVEQDKPGNGNGQGKGNDDKGNNGNGNGNGKKKA